MGFQYVVPTIVGGTVLVIERVESQNYVAGTSGWVIAAGGSAEFNDVTSRGDLVVGDPTVKYISIINDPQPIIKIGTPGNAEETLPASLQSFATSFSSYLIIASPERNSSGNDASISLIADDTPRTQLALNADQIYLNNAVLIVGNAVSGADLSAASNTFPASLVTLTGTQTLTNKDLSSGTNTFPTSLVTLTGTQTLTNKDLSSSTNTFPSIPYSVAYSGTTDANGFLTVTHGASFTPIGGWAVTTNPASSFAQFWGIDTIGATTVRLRFATALGGVLASTAVTGRLFLVR